VHNPDPLPCAFEVAHGKEVILYRVLWFWHTAKVTTAGGRQRYYLFFAVGQRSTWQSLCRMSKKRPMAKSAFPADLSRVWHMVKDLLCVLWPLPCANGTHQRSGIP